MKVSDSPSSSEIFEQNRKLDEKLRHTQKSKEAEIESLKKIYDQRLVDTKSQGEENYIAALEKNDERLIGASKDFEEKLNNYKANLEKTQQTLTAEERALKEQHVGKLENQKEQFLTNIHEQYMNAAETQDSIKTESNNSVQKIADKSRAEKNHLQFKAQTEINALANEFNNKGISEERNYRALLDSDVKQHEEAVRFQKTELKKVMDKDFQQAKRLETEKEQIHKAELTFLDEHHKDMMAQKDRDFKVRYENMVKSHDEILNNIKTALDEDVKKLVADSASQKHMVTSKIEDKFYRIEKLNPSITETEKDLTVSLKVPEHEKENVHLSVNGRELKMTLARKFTDTLDSEDGSTNKSTRSELFSKEMSVKDILNGKKIIQKYENGILSYKIEKA